MRKGCYESEADDYMNNHIAFTRQAQEFIKILLDHDAQIEEKVEAPSLETQKAYNVCYPTKMGKISVVIGIIEIGRH